MRWAPAPSRNDVRHVDAHHAAAPAEHVLEGGSGRAVDITADAEYGIALGEVEVEVERGLLDHPITPVML